MVRQTPFGAAYWCGGHFKNAWFALVRTGSHVYAAVRILFIIRGRTSPSCFSRIVRDYYPEAVSIPSASVPIPFLPSLAIQSRDPISVAADRSFSQSPSIPVPSRSASCPFRSKLSHSRTAGRRGTKRIEALPIPFLSIFCLLNSHFLPPQTDPQIHGNYFLVSEPSRCIAVRVNWDLCPNRSSSSSLSLSRHLLMAGSRGQSSKEDYVNHYAVLGLPSGEEGSKLSLEEIRKAYRKQSRIRHPDKRPDDPNATADFQLLTSSFEFLLDKVNRSNFDAKLRARRDRYSFQDAKRRKMATDLEERERSAAVAVDPAKEVRLKEKRMAYELKKEIAELKARRAKKASESVCRQQNGESKVGGENTGGSLDKGRTLKVSWEPSAGDYGASKLRGIFESFGIVEDVVIRSNSSKKKALAFIVMASREAVVRAVQSLSGEIRNPLLVLPLEPIGPMFSDTTSTNQNESMGPGINNVVGIGFQEYEAFVMKKLQEANEKKKCMR